MPTLNIEGVGRVTVSDDFVTLPPDRQQATVKDITQQIRAKGVAQEMTLGSAGLQAIGNIPASALRFAKDFAQPFIHPIETVQNLGAIGKGVLQKTHLVTGDDSEKYADAVGGWLMARYGSQQAILKTLAEDPVGLAADVSIVLTGGGAVAARAPGVVGRVGEAAGAVGRAIDPVNAAVLGAKGAGMAASATLGGTLAPRMAARADLRRALDRDSMTPQGAEAAGQALAADRPGATVADVGGENVRGLVERVAQTPGAGRTAVKPFLTDRQEQQAGRIATDLADLTGTKKSAFQAINDTMQTRATQGRPLYQKAMSFDANADADIVTAFEEATSTGWGAAILKSPAFRRNVQSEFRVKDVADAPLMIVLDGFKKAADDLAGQAVRAGKKNEARVISDARDSVLDVVKAKNPAYQQALSAWAGKSAYLDAIEEGKGILSSKLSAEELTANLAKLGTSEKEAFRIGAVSAVRSKFGNDPAKLSDATKYLRSPEVRAKIAAIMPTPQAAEA